MNIFQCCSKWKTRMKTVSKAIYSYCNQKLTGLCSNTTSWMYMQSPSTAFDSWTSARGADGARGTAGGWLRNPHPPGKQQAVWGIVATAKSVFNWRNQGTPPPTYTHHQQHFSGLFKFLLCIRHRRNLNQCSHSRHILKPSRF